MPKPVLISEDEVIAKRKDVTNDDGVIFKASVGPRSWDEKSRSAVFIMSAEIEDSFHDVVMQSGIDLTRFSDNPIAFFNHNSRGTPIGTWGDIKTVRSSPKRTEGRMTFVGDGIDDMADKVARHVAGGSIKAASIGFRSKKTEKILDEEGNWINYGFKFHEIELYECSVVTVPAVRQALVKANGGTNEFMSPEVIEEFLEHLKANPAIAQLVDKSVYEDALREAIGNKSFSIAKLITSEDALSIKTILSEHSKEMEDIASRIEKASGVEIKEEELPDPLMKQLENELAAVVTKVEPEIETIEDDERKSVLSAFVSSIKSIFKTEPEEPVAASQEAKDALRARLEALESRQQKAA